MDTQPFDYEAAVRELEARVAQFLWNNKETTLKEAAALFNATEWQLRYIMRKHGMRRPRGGFARKAAK